MTQSMSFTLHPFAADAAPPEVRLTGTVQRQDSCLALRFELLDPLGLVVLTVPAIPARTFGLWDATCFELFVGTASERYWEFNLSPAGHWNTYRFDGYRQGMEDELAFNQIPFSVIQNESALTLDLSLDLSPIIPADQPLDLSITAVLQLKPGAVSYWALTHCADQADFHHRDSFTVKL